MLVPVAPLLDAESAFDESCMRTLRLGPCVFARISRAAICSHALEHAAHPLQLKIVQGGRVIGDFSRARARSQGKLDARQQEAKAARTGAARNDKTGTRN